MSTISAGTTSTTALVSTGDTTGNLILATGSVPTTALTLNSTTQAATFAGTLATASRGITAASMPVGSVIQVVNANYTTLFSTSSTSFQATGLTASITPSSSTSKILILVTQELYQNTANASGILTIYRGSTSGTNLGNSSFGFASNYAGSSVIATGLSAIYLDSPATTASTTYITATRTESGSVVTSANSQVATMILMEIAA